MGPRDFKARWYTTKTEEQEDGGFFGGPYFFNLSPCFLIWIYDPDIRDVMTLRCVEAEL